MATIQKRSGTRGTTWRVLIRLSGRTAQSRTFDKRPDAIAWARETEAKLRNERAGVRRTMTLEEAISRYRLEVMPRKRAGSQEAQTGHLDYWADVLGHVRLDQVTPQLVSECREDLRRPRIRTTFRAPKDPATRANATINRYLATLGHLFSVAIREWGITVENPVKNVSRMPEPQGRVRFLSDDERRRLLEAAGNISAGLRLAVLLAITTGMRRAELLSLRWRHIDIERRLITLETTKTGQRRSVPIPTPALAELRELSQGKGPADYVWPSPVRPGHYDRFGTAWRRLRESAQLENFRWHDMRHTAASYLAMSGASLRDLAEILGHQTLSMVQRYSHLTATHTIAVVDKMTAAMDLDGAGATAK